ncbi:MAG TPA: hypothetical protein PL033_06645 [Candidatus Brocadiia bacterium]|nr:hypothetical protein [Candidatus Brocadiia bacterium]
MTDDAAGAAPRKDINERSVGGWGAYHRDGAALALAVMIAALCVLTVAFNRRRGDYSRFGDVGMFSTEGAMKYRYMKQVALGGEIPERDLDAEFPEGIRPWAEVPLFMEVIAGRAYRILGAGMAVHEFQLVFISLWTALNLIPLYLWARWMTGSRLAAVCAAALYATCLSYLFPRLVFAYAKEDFSLLPIFAGCYLLLRAMAGSSDNADGACCNAPLQYGDEARAAAGRAILAGAMWLLAMANWHLSQFYFMIFLCGMAACVALSAWTQFCEMPRPGAARTMGLTLLVVGAGSFGIPCLAETGFAAGPAFCLGLAVIAALVFMEKRPDRLRLTPLVLIGAFVALFLIAGAISGRASVNAYSHVYSAMRFKLTEFLSGGKPPDPTPYDWEGMVMSCGPFKRMTLDIAWKNFGALFALAPIGFALCAAGWRRRKEIKIAEFMTTFLVASLFGLMLLMQRMDRPMVFFAAIFAALIWPPSKSDARRREREGNRNMFLCLMIAGLIWNANVFKQHGMTLERQTMESRSWWFPTVKWIRANTPEDACFAGPFPIMPAILLDTGRRTAFHSDFEIVRTRRKVMSFENTFFQSDDALWKWCRINRVDYLLIVENMLTDTTPEGMRYRTKNIRVGKSSVAYGLVFAPERLEMFELVFSNEGFRIYRVMPGGDKTANKPSARIPWNYDKWFGQGADLGIGP